MISWLMRPPRLDFLHKWLVKSDIAILDVGCGNHSPSRTKRYYPHSRYYGLDRNKNCLSDIDLKSMEDFYEIDLSNLAGLESVPTEFFDCIILCHVIEHIENGEEVIAKLSQKLRKNGVIYLETPSEYSLRIPSTVITQGFHEDDTHLRFYSRKELIACLKDNGFKIIKSGIRKSFKRIAFLPIYMLGALLLHQKIKGVFWDITGFVSLIIAQK